MTPTPETAAAAFPADEFFPAHPFGGEWDQTGVDANVNFPITKWHALGALGSASLILAACSGTAETPSEPSPGLFSSVAQSVAKNIEFLVQNPLEAFVTLTLSGATYGAVQFGLDILKHGGGWTAEKGKGFWGRVRKGNGDSGDEEGETIQLTARESRQMGEFMASFAALVNQGAKPENAMKNAFYQAVFQPARENNKESSKSGIDLIKSLMKVPREAKQWLTAAALGFTFIKFLQLYAPEISSSTKVAAAVFAVATVTAMTSLEAILPEGWSFTLARKKDR